MYEADLWESFIQQYLQERQETIAEVEYERQKKLEVAPKQTVAAVAVLHIEPEPEPEPEVTESEDEDDDTIPTDISENAVAKLERILAEHKVKLEEQKFFEENAKKELVAQKKKIKMTKARLARVNDDIKHEKMKRGGGGDDDGDGAEKSFSARFAMFNQ